MTAVRPLQDVFVSAHLTDISGAESAYVAAPTSGRVVKIFSVIHGAITVADAILTPDINGTNMTGGAITVAFTSSAAGDVDSSTPSALNVVQEGDALGITSNAGPTAGDECTVTFVIRRS